MAKGIAVGLKGSEIGPIVSQAGVEALANMPSIPVPHEQREWRFLAGIWSMIGTLLLCFWVGVNFGGFQTLSSEFGTFLSGGALSIETNGDNILEMFPLILASTGVEVLASFVCLFFLLAIFRGETSKNHKVGETIEKIDRQKSLFIRFILLCVGEEIFARAFLLGWVRENVPGCDGPLMFYVLFLLGNSIWAYIHLFNYEKEDRHIIKVLPQFVGGVFFTYIYVKYGLMGSLLDHFASNAVLFCLHKRQRLNWVDGALIAVTGALSCFSFWMLQKPLSDLQPWFGNLTNFQLVGWSFFDYLWVGIFMTSFPKFIFGLLLYDRSNIGSDIWQQKDQQSSESVTPAQGVLGILLAAGVIALYMGAIYGGFELLGMFIDSVPIRVLTLSMAMMWMVKSNSVSAMARAFWTVLPSNYIFLCSLMALGFWWSTVLVLARVVIMLPQSLLLKLDD